MVSFYKPAKRNGQKSTAKPRSGESVTLTIDTVDIHGKGVAKSHQPVVFVHGALEGETVLADITDKKKHHWQAVAKTIQVQSDSRQLPFCPHVETCGGCQLQHVKQEAGVQMRQQALDNDWKRRFGLSHIPWVAPLSFEGKGYRRKARLAVDVRDRSRPKIGYKSAQTNRVVDIQQCQVLDLRLQALLEPLKALIASLQSADKVGHISLLAGDNVTQCTIRVSKSVSTGDKNRLRDFGEKHHTNVVVESQQSHFEFIHRASILECGTLDNLKLVPQPHHFVQVNGVVNSKMIEQAMAWLVPTENDTLADLFCGLGNFTLPLAKTGATVVAAEGVESMVQDAKTNALQQGIKHVQWQHLDLSQRDSVAQCIDNNVNKILLDPSREGALQVCEAISEKAVDKVLYVSCNPTTFARDAQILLDAGYTMEKVGLVEMFPYTRHLEVMALFGGPAKSRK